MKSIDVFNVQKIKTRKTLLIAAKIQPIKGTCFRRRGFLIVWLLEE